MTRGEARGFRSIDHPSILQTTALALHGANALDRSGRTSNGQDQAPQRAKRAAVAWIRKLDCSSSSGHGVENRKQSRGGFLGLLRRGAALRTDPPNLRPLVYKSLPL